MGCGARRKGWLVDSERSCAGAWRRWAVMRCTFAPRALLSLFQRQFAIVPGVFACVFAPVQV